jgi:urease accessory protein UreF
MHNAYMTPSKTFYNEPTERVTLSIPASLKDRLQRLVKEKGGSMAGLATQLMIQALAQEKEDVEKLEQLIERVTALEKTRRRSRGPLRRGRVTQKATRPPHKKKVPPDWREILINKPEAILGQSPLKISDRLPADIPHLVRRQRPARGLHPVATQPRPQLLPPVTVVQNMRSQ